MGLKDRLGVLIVAAAGWAKLHKMKRQKRKQEKYGDSSSDQALGDALPWGTKHAYEKL